MTDEKKPRKIKDLKARLGRTIAPNTPGEEDEVAAPNLGAAAPAATAPEPSAPAPAAAAPGIVAPPAAV